MKMVYLGEIVKYIRGITFKPDNVEQPHTPGSVVCMRTKNVQTLLDESDIIAVNSRFIKRDEQYLEEGDILVSSANSWNLVGKTCYVPSLSYKATAGGFISIVRPKRNLVDARYLYYWLSSNKTQHYARLCGRQTTNISNLDRERFLQLRLPLPPLEEQRRIAGILDKADEVRRQRQEAIRLTEELLKSLFLDMFGDPVTNPKGCEVKPLGEISKFLGGGTPSRKIPEYFDGDICWASSKDMANDILLDTQEHITEEAINNSSTKLVQAGVLLVVVKSKILMRRLPVVRTTRPTCFNQDIKAIIPNDILLNRYLHHHLKLGQETLLRQARGVNTEGLTLEHLSKYPVMIPPNKQIKFFVDLDIKLAERIKTIQSCEREANNLFNSLLQKAFRGEL